MEEFVPGAVTTYGGVCNCQGGGPFCRQPISPDSIMDVVNEGAPCCYYVDKQIPPEVEKAGKAVLAAFGATRRFFHLEFFRLTADKAGLGRKGDIVALEVNMRPAGGFTPDMLNFSQSVDVYQIWADMVAFDECRHTYAGEHSYCVYTGRRDGVNTSCPPTLCWSSIKSMCACTPACQTPSPGRWAIRWRLPALTRKMR